MGMKVELTGWSEAQGKLKLIRETMRDKTTTAAVREGGKIVLEEMILSAPVLAYKNPGSSAHDPGTLKESLGERTHRPKAGIAEALVGPFKAAYLAGWVEYGHRLVRGGYSSLKRGKMQGRGKEVGFVPAHPFLRPAFEATRARAMEKMAQVFSAGVRRLANGR